MICTILLLHFGLSNSSVHLCASFSSSLRYLVQANSWRPIEDNPCRQQRIITTIQVHEGFGHGLASNLGICTLAGTISTYVPRLERPRRYDPGRNNLGMFWISKTRIFRSIRNSFSNVGFSYSWKTSKSILISFKFELVSYSWRDVPSIFIGPFGCEEQKFGD